MAEKLSESGEAVFLRVLKYSLVRSLPFAAIPLLAALICAAAGYSHAIYFGAFLTCCILAVVCAAGANVVFIYRAFPRDSDKKSGVICYAVLLSGFIATLFAVAASFAGSAIYGAITKTGHAGAFLLILDNAFTAAFVLFCAAHLTAHALFLATCLAVLNGKRKAKRIVSRTCRAAIPTFTLLGAYYVVAVLLFTFADMSFTANIAVEYFLTTDVTWLLASLIPISLAASFALCLLCAKSARKAKK